LHKNGYRLSDAQAQAILEMRLQRLTGLEQDKIVAEYKQLIEQIGDFLDMLGKPARITAIISEELKAIKQQYGDKRKSEIVEQARTSRWRSHRLGGRSGDLLSRGATSSRSRSPTTARSAAAGAGKQAATTKEDDFIGAPVHRQHARHDAVLFLARQGLLAEGVQRAAGNARERGKPIVNLFPLSEGEKINAVLPVKEYDDKHFVFLATALGTVKKTPLSQFSNPREKGIIAVELDDGGPPDRRRDHEGKHDVMLFSDAGKAVALRGRRRAADGTAGARRAWE